MTQAENLIREGLRAITCTETESQQGKGTTPQRRTQWKPDGKAGEPHNPRAFARAGARLATSRGRRSAQISVAF